MRGRIRTIKPELFQDEELWDLAERERAPILQAFAGLWCFADKEGRFEWRPRALHALILPYWDGDFAAVLAALESARFIVRYSVDGRVYGYVRNFRLHQAVNNREEPSKLPEPPAVDATTTRGARDSGVTERNGNGNGNGNGSGIDARAPVPPVRTTPRPLPDVANVGIARTYTMPCETPPKAYLDIALMGGVGPDQAKSTWAHYWGSGLPQFGVEKLHDWLTLRAKERQESQARLKKPEKGPNQPNAGLTGLEIFTRKAG